MATLRTRRTIVAAITCGVVVAGIVLAVILQKPAAKTIYNASDTLQYTSSISGIKLNDIPSEASNQLVPPATLTSVSIDGSDALGSYLSDDQETYVLTSINTFLGARSDQFSINAGIQKNIVSQSNDTISFKLIVLEPQATYTVLISNFQSGAQPDITFSRIEA